MAEKLISCNWVDPRRMRPAQQRSWLGMGHRGLSRAGAPTPNIAAHPPQEQLGGALPGCASGPGAAPRGHREHWPRRGCSSPSPSPSAHARPLTPRRVCHGPNEPLATQAALPTPCLMLPLRSFPLSSTAPHQTPPSWQPGDVREPWRVAELRSRAARVHGYKFPLHMLFDMRGGRGAGLTPVANHRAANKIFPFYFFMKRRKMEF